MKRLFDLYTRVLGTHPFATNAVSGFAIASVGDVAAQLFEHRTWKDASHTEEERWSLDARRTLQLGLIRSAIIAPFISFWYPFLARTFQRTVSKIAFDQAFGSPLVIGVVFAANEILSSGSFSFLTFSDKFLKDGCSAWKLGVQYWPLVHIVTFGILPVRHQPLFAHAASVPWNAVLSHYANKLDRYQQQLRLE